MLTIAVLVIAGFTWYVLEPEERARVIRTVAGVLSGGARHAAAAARGRRRAPDAFDAALADRKRLPVAAPIFAAINLLVFMTMASGPGAAGDPETLARWGASVGPLTSNGEWTRLLTSIFVHTGLLHLVVNTIVLVQLGLVIERLAGTAAFTAVYLASGLFAGLVSLAAFPVAVTAGASGAIAGLYGFLLAAVVWMLLPGSRLRIPRRVFRALAPTAAAFVFYNLVDGALQTGAELAGALTGAVCGLGLARGIGAAPPPLRRVVAAGVTVCVFLVLCALPLRGITDVRPELERLVALEAQMDAAYEHAVSQFRAGAMSARQLADLIERTIVPELHAAQARLRGLDRVPRAQRHLLASAEEYLRLRNESFRLRAEALQTSNMKALRDADQRERDSLAALEDAKPLP